MNPKTVKTLMSLVGTIAAAAMLVPQFVAYQAALSALSAGLLAWAHGKRPGDESARSAKELRGEIELLKGEGPKTPRSVPPSVPPSAAALLLLAGALALNQTACSSPQLPTADQVLTARDKTELAVTLAGQALPVVQVEVDRLTASGALPPDKADQARAALSKADGVLVIAEMWLAGKAEAPGRDEVLQALDAAELAISIATTAGGKLPPIVGQAIELARRVVEEKR